MVCQNCGHNNQPQETRCSKCGQPLPVNMEPKNFDSLYAPTAAVARDDGKTAVYVAPEDRPAQNKPAASEASRTIVKPSAQVEVAKTIVKAPVRETPAAPVPEASRTIVKPSAPVAPAPVAAAKTIVKAPVQEASVAPEASKTIVRPSAPVAAAPEAAAKTIVRSPAQEAPASPAAQTIVGEVPVEPASKTVCQTIISCPNCGYYPLLSSLTECPQCKKPIPQPDVKPAEPKPVVEEPVAPKSEETKPAVDDIYNKAKAGGKEGAQGTICRPFYLKNSVDDVKKEPQKPATFKLTLIPEDGEQVTAVTKQYEGNEVLLNRDNTEPMNMSITSKEQAEITCEDGRWFIENKSQMKTTYLAVERKVELQEGDIIILGSRRFKFEA